MSIGEEFTSGNFKKTPKEYRKRKIDFRNKNINFKGVKIILIGVISLILIISAIFSVIKYKLEYGKELSEYNEFNNEYTILEIIQKSDSIIEEKTNGMKIRNISISFSEMGEIENRKPNVTITYGKNIDFKLFNIDTTAYSSIDMYKGIDYGINQYSYIETYKYNTNYLTEDLSNITVDNILEFFKVKSGLDEEIIKRMEYIDFNIEANKIRVFTKQNGNINNSYEWRLYEFLDSIK